MATPFLRVTPLFGTSPVAINLTDKTGGSSDWGNAPTNWHGGAPGDVNGSTFWYGKGGGGRRGVTKGGMGDEFLAEHLGTLVNETVSGFGGGWYVYTDPYDVMQRDSGGGYSDTLGQWNYNTNPAGMRHTGVADGSLRSLFWHGDTYGGGWGVEAELTDDSAADATLALPNGDFIWSAFRIDWLAESPCQMRFSVVRRASGTSGIRAPYLYTLPPRPPRRTRGSP